MPIWEVNITRTSYQNVEVQAESEEEAIFRAHQMTEEQRGPETVHWDYDASQIERAELSDDE